MSEVPEPPRAFQDFVSTFPKLGEAWDLMSESAQQGPLDEKSARLVKLGIAIGSLREGAVGSAVRKAVAAGATQEDLEQVIALAASTIGLPSAVAVHTWIKRELAKRR